MRDEEVCALEWAWEIRLPELDEPDKPGKPGIRRSAFIIPAEEEREGSTAGADVGDEITTLLHGVRCIKRAYDALDGGSRGAVMKVRIPAIVNSKSTRW